MTDFPLTDEGRDDFSSHSSHWSSFREMSTALPQDFARRDLILELARRLARHPTVERVWLFGSRARGDNAERSDIDLALLAPAMSDDDWVRLHLDFADEAPTLLCIDLVRLDQADQDLRARIEQEGIVLYERARAREPDGRSRPGAGSPGRGAAKAAG